MASTRDECEAGVLLVDAFLALPHFRKALRQKGRHRIVELVVGTSSDGGMTHDADIEVDIETGRLILQATEKIISERMAAIGVSEPSLLPISSRGADAT